MIDKEKIEGFKIFDNLTDEQLEDVCEKMVEREYKKMRLSFPKVT